MNSLNLKTSNDVAKSTKNEKTMQSKMNLSQFAIVLTFLSLIAYDVLAGPNGQPTISMALRDWAWHWTYLPFTFGFLITHWFFPRRNADVSGWMWALPFFIGLIAFDLLWHQYGVVERPWFRYPGFYVLIGGPVGFFLWPQPSAESIFK